MRATSNAFAALFEAATREVVVMRSEAEIRREIGDLEEEIELFDEDGEDEAAEECAEAVDQLIRELDAVRAATVSPGVSSKWPRRSK